MRFARDPVAAVTPAAGRRARRRADHRLDRHPAVHPQRAARAASSRHLEPLLAGLAARGVGERFHVYVLSDTSEPDVAAAEDARFAALADAWRGRVAITYRRRADNTGFKAGNIRDFCDRWGKRPRLRASCSTPTA